MSATKKLRLGPLPKTESVKLTFACPAGLKADLDRYAALHAQAYGEAVDAMFDRLPKNDTAAFSRALARHLRNGVLNWWKVDRLRLVDPLASAVVVDPTIITKTVTAGVQVSLAEGIARGMTVIDPSGRYGTPRFTLVEEVDAQRLHDLYAVSAAYSPQQALEPT